MPIVHVSRWTTRFTAWQRASAATMTRATEIDRAAQARGWALAATVEIPQCMCCLHNAALDDNLIGWCKDNPHRLAVAQRANYMVNRTRAADLARKRIAQAYQSMVADE